MVQQYAILIHMYMNKTYNKSVHHLKKIVTIKTLIKQPDSHGLLLPSNACKCFMLFEA